ncbi:Sulfotransferase domain-containing protein [Cognatiyoonia sediminum]|uniref:Sulfotransferase domain-containing protein n=2 Tax=Cognatiyoonia sediminum TaxID=1508389 RepID=A0A1M5QX98_9RHOB|nr:Sulfotransferase domain-containing protein [Cognatiyoonia sediminum]
MNQRLPSFFIIGAMKCGTSTLQTQLSMQNGIFMCEPKEPNFFSDDGIFAKGIDWYKGLFETAQEADLLGEASTHYTKLPNHPHTIPRLQNAVLKPRFVYMIRNPVARSVSHFIHEWSQGVLSDDLEKAFTSNPELVDYGRYGMQIRPWIETFGKESVFLTSLEQIKADPQGELSAICSHIGFEGDLSWQEDIEAQNVSSERVRKFPLHSLLVDHPISAKLRRTLVPKSLRDRVKASRQMSERPTLPPELKQDLEGVFEKDRRQLAALFPEHPALKLCYPFLE